VSLDVPLMSTGHYDISYNALNLLKKKNITRHNNAGQTFKVSNSFVSRTMFMFGGQNIILYLGQKVIL
jgi:hypothetical protein